VTTHPACHLLQHSHWGALKSCFGWQAVRLALEKDGRLCAGAQVLFRRLPLGRSLAYLPKGPLLNPDDAETAARLWPALHALARSRRSILLKVEPELPDDPALAARFRAWGFRPSPQTVQPRRTIWLDLAGDEEAILGGMKSKTRYNIRLAARKEVQIHQGTANDLDTFYTLMQQTGARDGFGIHSRAYYRAAHELFASADQVRLFLAFYAGEPLGALMAFACGDKAWYFYGASSDRERQRMASYLLQWEAIRWARWRGCTAYDLWGIPDADETSLEAQFTARSDGLWGVYRFKRGFGGRVQRYLGAFDAIYSPLWYRLYAAYAGRRQAIT